MNHTLTQSDRQFLAQLQRSGPQRVIHLCDTHGVTATAVRHRLSRLLSAGMIERHTVQAGRGRPHHEYLVTETGRQSLGDDYASLARLLWQEVLRLEEGDTRRHMLAGLRRAMVERYRPESPAETLSGRFDQLSAALDREGFDVETSERASDDELLPVLREHSCPYHELAADDRSICELEQSVFEDVLGVSMTLTQCCHDGHSYCEFEPVIAG